MSESYTIYSQLKVLPEWASQIYPDTPVFTIPVAYTVHVITCKEHQVTVLHIPYATHVPDSL